MKINNLKSNHYMVVASNGLIYVFKTIMAKFLDYFTTRLSHRKLQQNGYAPLKY